ncbi:MAG: SDR family oxidoreductase [Proteobacteria bacterium]|nr:SDR family oxidoreductase [Pseudomonadota bacterium]
MTVRSGTIDQELADFGLVGRVALVTGAASGIGRATAELLAACGAMVVAVDIDAAGLGAIAGKAGASPRIAGRACDISSAAACADLIAETAARYGRLDVLANVAAVIRRLGIEDVDEAEWRRLMNTNLKSQFFLGRAAGEIMRRSGWGRIINVSSGAGLVGGFVGATVYAATKSGIITVTRSLARELAPHGICVNTISPGAIDTPMQRTGMTEENLAKARASIPLARMGEPIEVARAIAFLASDLASYITGHILAVDGGFLMR